MRCSHFEPILTMVWSGIFLAIAVAFPAVNFSQQSLHSIQFDAGSGVARNPMQSTVSGLMGSSAVSMKGWGHQSAGRTVMHWKGSLKREAYSGQPVTNQFRINGHVGLRRALGDHAETGVEAGVSQGTVWERSLRYREEWRAFDAGHWSGAWWMALRVPCWVQPSYVISANQTYSYTNAVSVGRTDQLQCFEIKAPG